MDHAAAFTDWSHVQSFLAVADTGSLSAAAEVLGQIPYIYNLDTDPKEIYNLFGRSGGIALFEPMVRDVVAPYLVSLRSFPNRDYSNMTRDR